MNVGGYLDLQALWHILTGMHNIILPYPGKCIYYFIVQGIYLIHMFTVNPEGGQGLSSLVHQCLGKPLNKENQFSNWERRPLRKNQIIYAGNFPGSILSKNTKI
jgi:hypothetical protein